MIALSLFFHSTTTAQVDLLNEKQGFPYFHISYSYQVPGHDLAKRFGHNSGISGGFLYKTRSNFAFGIETGFLFSENIKNESQYLQHISTEDGFVISEAGKFGAIFLHQRGFYFGGRIGRIFPIIGPNPNSGLMIMAGAGMLQHQIRFDIEENNVPQLRGDYLRGYDRLTNGPSINQYIGFINFDNNRVINFHAGFEFIQAWTQSRRPYDFDRMQPDRQNRFETIWSIRIGWMVPIYQRTGETHFYF